MKKGIIAAALLLLAALAAWQLGLLPSAGNASGKNSFLEHIPADTAYYFGGANGEQIAKAMYYYPINASPSSYQTSLTQLKDVIGDSPGAQFAQYFLFEPLFQQTSTVGEYWDYYGFDLAGEMAVYSHGAIPVFRLSLLDATLFEQRITDAVSRSGFAFNESTLGASKIKSWRLSSDETNIDIDFIISHSEHVATITLFTNLDTDADKKERLGLKKPKNNLASSGQINALQTRYGFLPNSLGFIHFEQISKAFTEPQNNRLGQDINRYLPAEQQAELQTKLDANAKADLQLITQFMPRLVMGYKTLDIKDHVLSMDFRSIFEITSAATNTELMNMRGHIPLHTTESKGKLFTTGVGIDTIKLVPALTALWTAFTTAEFKSQTMLEAQAQAKQTSPALLSMAMGMVYGIKGVGLSVFDAEFNLEQQQINSLDALLSIAADKPEAIIGMAKMLPMLADLTLPSDGSETALNLAFIPANININAAIKGQQIVIFSGEKSRLAAAQIANEDLSSNGLILSGLDYRRFGEIISSLPATYSGAQTCVQQQELVHALNQLNMDAVFGLDNNQHGIELFGEITMDISPKTTLDLSGDYQIDMLNEHCQWEDAGKESINSDGTGVYVMLDESGTCELFRSEYQWQQQGQQLLMTPSNELSRDTCTQSLEKLETENASCQIINQQTGSFQCIFESGTEQASIYRYQKI